MKKLKKLIKNQNPSLIISVGDVVSHNMIQYEIFPDLLIVDNRVMRKPIQPININADQTLHARNPPGTLTDEAWVTIRDAIEQNGQTRVIIDGEEDLLTIAVVVTAPKDAIVVYGQPHEGIVIVKVTEETKKRMLHIIDEMKQSSKS